MNLYGSVRVLVSRQITALDGMLQFLGGARQALAMDARRVRKDVRGLLRERGTIISPLNLGPSR